MIRFGALFDIPSASKFFLRLSRPLVAENSASRGKSTFLQDLSVDLSVLVEVVGFLQTFLEALKIMVGLAMLGFLRALDTNPDLLSEAPLLNPGYL